jgi:iron complex transport system substrate-binding protein
MRRNRLLVLAPVVALALAACGSSSSDDDTSGGGWTYTDGRGEKISLDAPPEKLVAQTSLAAALSDLGVEGIDGVFGPLKGVDGGVDRQADGLDPKGLKDVTAGGEYGSLDLEAITELDPDLVLTYQYLPDQLWYVNAATQAKLEKFAPIAVVDFEGKTLIETLDSVEDLAAELGADVDSAKAAKGREDFETAAARLKAAGEALGDKKIVVVSPATDVLYVSDPTKSPDLSYFTEELGLPIVQPDDVTEAEYFEDLSWENADKYEGDIALYDARVGDAGLAIFDDQPSWQTVEAGKNKAYVPWQSVAPPSYAAYAKIMNEIAEALLTPRCARWGGRGHRPAPGSSARVGELARGEPRQHDVELAVVPPAPGPDLVGVVGLERRTCGGGAVLDLPQPRHVGRAGQGQRDDEVDDDGRVLHREVLGLQRLDVAGDQRRDGLR